MAARGFSLRGGGSRMKPNALRKSTVDGARVFAEKQIFSRTDELLALVLAELQAIHGLLEQQRRPSSLTRSDGKQLSRLLPVIGGVFGSESFLARELFERDAPALRIVLDGLSTKAIGQLFKRAENIPVDGFMVQSDGTELNTVLWRVVRVDGFVGEGNRIVPPRTGGAAVNSAS